MKWRVIELYLVAGENGNDGLLPPVERLAWRLRLPQEKLAETLSALSQAGVVHETPQGWVVTDFAKSQAAMTSKERVQNMRRRKEDVTIRYKNGNENVTEVVADSTSTSTSSSLSVSESLEEKRVQGKEKPRPEARISPPLLPANVPTGPDSPVDVFRVYQPNLRVLAPMIAKALRDAEKSDGAESGQVTVTSNVTVTSTGAGTASAPTPGLRKRAAGKGSGEGWAQGIRFLFDTRNEPCPRRGNPPSLHHLSWSDPYSPIPNP